MQGELDSPPGWNKIEIDPILSIALFIFTSSYFTVTIRTVRNVSNLIRGKTIYPSLHFSLSKNPCIIL